MQMIIGALIFTVLWVILAIVYPGYLHDPLQSMLGQDAAKLGETGDYLAGWFTPLAFGWFIVAVTLQRKEFILMRKEYEASREAAQEQAKHLEQSNLVRSRQLFMEMIEDAKQADVFSAWRIQQQLFYIGRIQGIDSIAAEVTGKSILHKTLQALKNVHNDPNMLRHLHDAERTWPTFINSIKAVVTRRDAMRKLAGDAEMLEYYDDIL
jgi:hypothetical protein